jgi:lysophospholipase L1-like esterase
MPSRTVQMCLALSLLPALACQPLPRPDPPIRPPPLRILALGDSITQGRRGEPPQHPPTQSWRYPLWRELLTRGVNFDMVGGSRSGFEGDPEWPAVNGVPFDADHESRWGWRLDQIIALLREDMPRIELDVALVMLGGNDLGQGEALESLWPEWDALLSLLRSKNPHVAVVVGAYYDWDVTPMYTEQLRQRAQAWSTPHSPVRVVSACADWISDPKLENTDTTDWVHPNARGDAKLGAAFLQGLEQLFPARLVADEPATELARH